jgi:hypothetical protein
MAQATDTEIRDLLLGLDKNLDVHIAKTEEQLKSIEIQISDLKKKYGYATNRYKVAASLPR